MSTMRFHKVRQLPTPEVMQEMFPVSEAIRQCKEERDREIARIFTGESDRFILIIGPCSADREDAVLDYMNRLVPVQERGKDKILMISLWAGKRANG